MFDSSDTFPCNTHTAPGPPQADDLEDQKSPTPPPTKPGKTTRYRKALDQLAAKRASETPRKGIDVSTQKPPTPAKEARQEGIRRSPIKRHLFNAKTGSQPSKTSRTGEYTRETTAARREDIRTQVAVANQTQAQPSPSRRMQVQPPPNMPVRRPTYQINIRILSSEKRSQVK